MSKASTTALSNLFADTSVIDTVVGEEGLWSLISMSTSQNPEVQRHAARAFWHLAVHHENKLLLYEKGGLASLIKLSKSGGKKTQARVLADEALRRLREDQHMAKCIEEEERRLDEEFKRSLQNDPTRI